ncbi:nuclear transport factor 2 family protein [Sphingobium sp. EP60837]|uniref:nuclear transport factor 2 family protein n=1 Tax=Sphingobium sp. EP60837 TaxID=1855519 RepID=UPI0007DE2252|nr:nuclear transport factor 2 family protein [Sphingobium sp. EP60837]ANI80192.1 hypothetical protein EP837_03812 [Sphingobium sp. EP60837]
MSSPSPISTKQIALTFLDHVKAGGIDAAFDLISDDACIKGGDGTASSKTQLRMQLEAFRTLLASPFQQNILGITAEQNRVAIAASGRAELTNGRTYSNIYHFLFVIADGQIHEMREYCNTNAITSAFR